MAKSSWGKPAAHGELWRNLIVVRAISAQQAVSKVLKLGAQAQGDCDGTLRINAKPGLTRFLGVEDMGLIHEGLVDGSEILWQSSKCRQATARRLVKRRMDLIASLEVELASVKPISAAGRRAVRTVIRAELLRLKRKQVE